MNPHNLLVDDHAYVDGFAGEIEASLRDGNIHALASKLDMFWARLAVHIRAEHLHLFPAILRAFNRGDAINPANASLAEVEASVAGLRADHEFFMRLLASAVSLTREEPKDLPSDSFVLIRNIVRAVETRLKTHNEIEETLIYPLTMGVLSEHEQVNLAGRIQAELMNRPKRFTALSWGG